MHVPNSARNSMELNKMTHRTGIFFKNHNAVNNLKLIYFTKTSVLLVSLISSTFCINTLSPGFLAQFQYHPYSMTGKPIHFVLTNTIHLNKLQTTNVYTEHQF